MPLKCHPFQTSSLTHLVPTTSFSMFVHSPLCEGTYFHSNPSLKICWSSRKSCLLHAYSHWRIQNIYKYRFSVLFSNRSYQYWLSLVSSMNYMSCWKPLNTYRHIVLHTLLYFLILWLHLLAYSPYLFHIHLIFISLNGGQSQVAQLKTGHRSTICLIIKSYPLEIKCEKSWSDKVSDLTDGQSMNPTTCLLRRSAQSAHPIDRKEFNLGSCEFCIFVQLGLVVRFSSRPPPIISHLVYRNYQSILSNNNAISFLSELPKWES